MRLVPALLIVLALPLLAACNQVYSRQPLVSEAREQGDPELRPGLWKVGDDSADLLNCPFDIRRRLGDWPDCAVGLEVRRGQMFVVSRHERAMADTYRLIDGQPLLMQLHLHNEIFRDPRLSQPKDTDNPFYGWTYAAITVLKSDAAARITQAELVRAECGPVPSNTDPLAPGSKSAPIAVSSRPYPGLVVAGVNCVAKDLDAVKTALAQSANVGAPVPIRWIRDTP